MIREALGLPDTRIDRMFRGWQAWEEGDAGPGAMELELTRFRGHLILTEVGVRDGQDPTPIPG